MQGRNVHKTMDKAWQSGQRDQKPIHVDCMLLLSDTKQAQSVFLMSADAAALGQNQAHSEVQRTTAIGSNCGPLSMRRDRIGRLRPDLDALATGAIINPIAALTPSMTSANRHQYMRPCPQNGARVQ